MVIEYETSKYITEKQKIEIEDTKNVFLQGVNPYDGLNTYFGIWSNENGLSIVTLISNRCVSYEYSKNKSIHTECDIKKYLADNRKVKLIPKEIFIEQLNRIKEIIKI